MILVKKIVPVAQKHLFTVNDDALLTEAAKSLGDRLINLVVVCDRNRAMVGVITKTDVVRRMSVCQGCSCTASVATVMTKDVISCCPGDSLHDVWLMMKERGLLHIPVVDESSRPLGVISARDALLMLLEGVEHEEALLRDYVMGIGYR